MAHEHSNPWVPLGEFILVSDWAAGAEQGFLPLHPVQSGPCGWVPAPRQQEPAWGLPASCQTLPGLCFFPGAPEGLVSSGVFISVCPKRWVLPERWSSQQAAYTQ